MTSNRIHSPAIRTTRVTKRYGDHAVLREFDFEVPAGQKVAVIGRSGSGKTTLLRLLMTLEHPDSGSIEVMGNRLPSNDQDGRLRRPSERLLREFRSSVGMVFQHFNLFPHMTALQNVVEAPIHVLGMEPEEARARGRELLTTVGLEAKTHAYPRQMSGGQQQRVAIARALAMRPKVMLFDEVTSALDPELVQEVLEVVRVVAQTSSMTMLIVTHEMSFARDIADRVIFMEDGRIIEDGPPSVVLTNPQRDETRRFLRAVLER